MPRSYQVNRNVRDKVGTFSSVSRPPPSWCLTSKQAANGSPPRTIPRDKQKMSTTKYTRIHYNTSDKEMEACASDTGCLDAKSLQTTPRGMPIPNIVPHAPSKPKRDTAGLRGRCGDVGASPTLTDRKVRRLFPEYTKCDDSADVSMNTSDLADSFFSGDESFNEFLPLEWDYSDSGFLDEDDYLQKRGEMAKSET